MAGMEIRIDSVEGQATPKDTFVSMRVGDYQKQSRFGSAKTYRFPQMEDEHRFARIEVFHRIGHLTVNLDNLPANEPVEVPVDLPELKLLPMKLAILSDSVEPKTDQKAKQQKAKNKVDAAQKYLAEHHVEEVIADAIREVIHEKPSDPHAFLSAQILKHAAKKQEEMQAEMPIELPMTENVVIANDLVDHSAPKLAAPPSAEVPFRQYYEENFHSLDAKHLENLYAKFAAKPKAESPPKSAVPAAPVSPPVVESEAVAAPAEVVPFAKRPSVGTWLISAPKKVKNEVCKPMEAVAASVKEAPKEASATKPVAASMTPFRDYYLSNVRSLPGMEKIYAKFPAQPKPASKPAAAEPLAQAAAEVATEVVPFAKRPSVGTWLSPAPKKLGGEQKAPETAPKLPEKTSEPEAAKPLKETPAAPVVQLLPFRDYYEAQVRSLPGMEKIYAKFPAQPKPVSKPKDSVAAPASSETKTTLFQHKPSVATWLNAVPLRKAAPVPPSILDRSRSRIVAMEKEEIVDAVVKEMKQKEQEFASELHKKDEEIARLKALLSK